MYQSSIGSSSYLELKINLQMRGTTSALAEQSLTGQKISYMF